MAAKNVKGDINLSVKSSVADAVAQDKAILKHHKRVLVLGVIALLLFLVGYIGLITKDLIGVAFSFDSFFSWMIVIWTVLSLLISILFILSVYIYLKPGLPIFRDVGLIFVLYIIISAFLVGFIFFGDTKGLIDSGNEDIIIEEEQDDGNQDEQEGPSDDSSLDDDTQRDTVVCDLPVDIAYPGVELVEDYNFNEPELDWFTHVWFKSSEDKYSEISNPEDGIINISSKAGNPNSRAGMMQELMLDVTNVKNLILRTKVKVDEATLPGTGLNAREAPIAIGVVYYDEDCVLRTSLPEDYNDTTTRMFWNGFNYIEDPAYSSLYLAKVDKGEWYEYSYDLASLNAKIIKSIGFEGAGWAPRSAQIDFLSLQAIKLKDENLNSGFEMKY